MLLFLMILSYTRLFSIQSCSTTTVVKMSNGSGDHDDEGYVVRLRGLPWSTTVDEILKFFSDCKICHGKAGIHMTMSREGRPSGEAYIEMEREEDIEKACKRDRDHMGHRYIEGSH